MVSCGQLDCSRFLDAAIGTNGFFFFSGNEVILKGDSHKHGSDSDN